VPRVRSPIKGDLYRGSLLNFWCVRPGVPLSEFKKLTRFPILIVYGDNIPKTEVKNPYQDYWRAASTMAQEFVKAVNAEGGHAKVLHLPDVGIKGNTHFPFSDKNSAEVAKVVEKWLSDNVK